MKKPPIITWVMILTLVVFGILALLVDGNGEIFGLNEFISILLAIIVTTIGVVSSLTHIIFKKYTIFWKVFAIVTIIIYLLLWIPEIILNFI